MSKIQREKQIRRKIMAIIKGANKAGMRQAILGREKT